MTSTDTEAFGASTVVRLTDDELAAYDAVGSDGWLPVLPTVGVDDAEALAAAAFRGRRSLTARGLWPGFSGTDPSAAAAVAELVAVARGTGHRIEVYLSDASLLRVSWHRSSFHYQTPEKSHWLLHSVVPVGLHSFGLAPATEQQAYLQTMIGAAFDRGPTMAPEDGQAAWLCLVSFTAERRVVVLARGGHLRRAADAHEGSAADLLESSEVLPGPAAAVDALLAGPAHSNGES